MRTKTGTDGWLWLIVGIVAGVSAGKYWLQRESEGSAPKGQGEELLAECDRAVQELENRISQSA